MGLGSKLSGTVLDSVLLTAYREIHALRSTDFCPHFVIDSYALASLSHVLNSSRLAAGSIHQVYQLNVLAIGMRAGCKLTQDLLQGLQPCEWPVESPQGCVLRRSEASRPLLGADLSCLQQSIRCIFPR